MNIIQIAVIASSLAASHGAEAWGTYNQQGRYGNPYGNDSNSVQLYAPSGAYLGNLNDNRYDPNSVSNPYGRYGSRYSQESINKPYG